MRRSFSDNLDHKKVERLLMAESSRSLTVNIQVLESYEPVGGELAGHNADR